MLITLSEKYRIKVDEYNHTLIEVVPPKEKEDGTMSKGNDKVLGYFPNVESCLRKLMAIGMLEETEELTLTFGEYCDKLQQTQEKILEKFEQTNLKV